MAESRPGTLKELQIDSRQLSIVTDTANANDIGPIDWWISADSYAHDQISITINPNRLTCSQSEQIQ